jgi:hypothetical protein
MADPKKSALSLGLAAVQAATVEDQKGNINEAVQLYSVALEHFQAANEETADEKVKDLIKKKSEMYIQRMEHLRFIILQEQFPETPSQETDIADLERQFGERLLLLPISLSLTHLQRIFQCLTTATTCPETSNRLAQPSKR